MIEHRWSQNSEQDILLQHFGEKADGRVLEIGAWDFQTFSNARALLLRGWSGVLVEPSPKPFVSLLEAYQYRPEIKLVNAAIAPLPGLVPFYDAAGDALSSLNPEQRAKWPDTAWREIWVSTITLDQLLVAFPGPYDLLSIDTESTSVDLLLAFPLAAMAERCACVIEHDGRIDELDSRMRHSGFRQAGRNTENCVYVR